MASYKTTTTFQLTDANGQTALMDFNTYTDDVATVADLETASGALITALGAPGVLTNAKVTRRGVSLLFDKSQTTPGATPLPIDAWFASVADKALLDFANAGGARSRIAIPAPIEAIFHAPPADLNVNPAYSAMATFITACEAFLLDPTLTALNLYKGGTYRGARRPKRMGRM